MDTRPEQWHTRHMNKEKVAHELCQHLHEPNAYKVVETSTYTYEIRSKTCCLELVFDRQQDTWLLFLIEPERKKPAMHFLLLRTLKKQGQTWIKKSDDYTPAQFCAELLNRYFQDELAGDFSIRKQYKAIEKEFFRKLLVIDDYPDDHPTKAKAMDCDISWLKEVKIKRWGRRES